MKLRLFLNANIANIIIALSGKNKEKMALLLSTMRTAEDKTRPVTIQEIVELCNLTTGGVEMLDKLCHSIAHIKCVNGHYVFFMTCWLL